MGECLALLIRGDAADGPAGLKVDSDEQTESLLLTRLDGPSLETDAADFRQMREKLKARLARPTSRGRSRRCRRRS